VATVSRFINDSAPVSEPVAERIEEVMTRLQYRPHVAARQLATKKLMAIGFLLNSNYNDYFGPLLFGIEDCVQQKGYNLLVATSRADRRVGSSPALGLHNVDGLLVFVDSLSQEELRDLHAQHLPMVLIHSSSPEGLNIPSVTVENKAATYKLIDHLITVHNRRKILFLRGKENQEDSYWREQGYKGALADHKIRYEKSLVLRGDFERKVAYQTMMDFLEGQNPKSFDAVFAGDDSAAIGVLDALGRHGQRVPQDVSVVGFNDSNHAAFLSPPLTTVKAPTPEVGRIAAQNLFSLINRNPVEPVTLLPTILVIRQSCGCQLT
jgi:DNA-binding LacI/PurR family transcriptional regulator